MLRNDQIYL